jgi:hypothetical protein
MSSIFSGLNTGIGGTTGGQIDPNTGMMSNQPIGPTYNDILKVALSGSRPGSTSQRLGATMPYTANTQSIQPIQPMQTPQEKNAATQDDSFSKIISMLFSLFAA